MPNMFPSHRTERRSHAWGLSLTALAAVGFSAKAILVKLAYRYQVDATTLLALRMAFALPFFLLIGWRGQSAPGEDKARPIDFFALAALGWVGYYLASYLDFLGLEYISAGLERLILFLYPTLVTLFSWILLGRPIKPGEIAALVLSYAGIGLVFRQQVSLGEPDIWLGAGLVFGSTVAYAAYLIGSQRAIAKLGARRFTAGAMTVACCACLAQFHPLSALALPAPVYALAFAMAIVSTVLPSLFMAMGIQRIGAARAALVGSLGPVATLALAYVALGEVMGVDQWLGAGLVLAGVLTVSLGKPK